MCDVITKRLAYLGPNMLRIISMAVSGSVAVVLRTCSRTLLGCSGNSSFRRSREERKVDS